MEDQKPMRAPNKVLKYDFGVRCAEDYPDYIKLYMREYNKTKIDCDCGRSIVKSKYRLHLESQIHLKRITEKLKFGLKSKK